MQYPERITKTFDQVLEIERQAVMLEAPIDSVAAVQAKLKMHATFEDDVKARQTVCGTLSACAHHLVCHMKACRDNLEYASLHGSIVPGDWCHLRYF